jgi:hypothetical protein
MFDGAVGRECILKGSDSTNMTTWPVLSGAGVRIVGRLFSCG